MSNGQYGGTNQPPHDVLPGAYEPEPPGVDSEKPPIAPYDGPPAQPPAALPDGSTPLKGEMPHEDVHDDPNRQAPAPSALPITLMETLPGYENVGSQNGDFLPPPSNEASMQTPSIRPELTNIPRITEDAATDALIQFASGYCCYGMKAAKECRILDLVHSSAFHYTLETFTETRATAWTSEPYSGQPVDGAFNGPAPGAWDIPVMPPQKFANACVKIEVPHTASVKACHECGAVGSKICTRCVGGGRLQCDSCAGNGRHRSDGKIKICSSCRGAGRRCCDTCNGNGRVICAVCAGQTKIKCFIQLTIQWNNVLLDHVVERTALPDELIRGVAGKLVFEEEAARVSPINHFPDEAVNQVSQESIQKQSQATLSLVLAQRQRVHIVPVCQCHAQFKEKPFQFFVYGFENRVHSPEYPQKCCCGCTLL